MGEESLCSCIDLSFWTCRSPKPACAILQHWVSARLPLRFCFLILRNCQSTWCLCCCDLPSLCQARDLPSSSVTSQPCQRTPHPFLFSFAVDQPYVRPSIECRAPPSQASASEFEIAFTQSGHVQNSSITCYSSFGNSFCRESRLRAR